MPIQHTRKVAAADEEDEDIFGEDARNDFPWMRTIPQQRTLDFASQGRVQSNNEADEGGDLFSDDDHPFPGITADHAPSPFSSSEDGGSEQQSYDLSAIGLINHLTRFLIKEGRWCRNVRMALSFEQAMARLWSVVRQKSGIKRWICKLCGDRVTDKRSRMCGSHECCSEFEKEYDQQDSDSDVTDDEEAPMNREEALSEQDKPDATSSGSEAEEEEGKEQAMEPMEPRKDEMVQQNDSPSRERGHEASSLSPKAGKATTKKKPFLERHSRAAYLVQQALHAQAAVRFQADLTSAHGHLTNAVRAGPAEPSQLVQSSWDVNALPTSSTTAAQCEQQIRATLDLERQFDRIQLIPRRNVGACLVFLQSDYSKKAKLPKRGRPAKQHQAEKTQETPMKFYAYVQSKFGCPPRRTKEYIRWYRLCVILPQLVLMPVKRWSQVRDLMVDKVLEKVAEAAAKGIGSSQTEQESRTCEGSQEEEKQADGKKEEQGGVKQRTPSSSQLPSSNDPPAQRLWPSSGDFTARAAVLSPYPSQDEQTATLSRPAASVAAAVAAAASLSINHSSTACPISTPMLTPSTNDAAAFFPMSASSAEASIVFSLPPPPVSGQARTSTSISPALSPDSLPPPVASSSHGSFLAAAPASFSPPVPPSSTITLPKRCPSASPHAPLLSAKAAHPIKANQGASASEPLPLVHNTPVQPLLRAQAECKNFPNAVASPTGPSSDEYRKRLSEFCKKGLGFQAKFQPSAPLLDGVSAGWIGVSMDPTTEECFYHVLGLLYGKRPDQLKQSVKDVIEKQFDTDEDLQQLVKEQLRDEPVAIDDRSLEQLKTEFLSRVDRAWGGSATLSILAKHSDPIFRKFQVWSINWEKGGVVRLGHVEGASLHTFVAHLGNHYYLLSRLPSTGPNAKHPYVFSGVDQAQACALAKWHNKSTSVDGTPKDDECMVIE